MLAIGFFLSALVVVAQQEETAPVAKEPAQAEQAADLWPSDKLMKQLLSRWADDLSVEAELDERQRMRARKIIVDRWSDFLAEHRTDIEPVLDGYLELRTGDAPPGKQAIQAWVRRAAKVFDELRNQVDAMVHDLRQGMDSAELSKLEAEVLEIDAALRLAKERLRNWTSGEFETAAFWKTASSQRSGREASGRRAQAASQPPQEPDQIALEVDSWTRFVESFIGRFRLDKGQCDAARSCLSELTQRALAHRDGNAARIAELEQRIASYSGKPSELEPIKDQLQELYGPVDLMFDELVQRMEKIPTKSQCARVLAGEKKE